MAKEDGEGDGYGVVLPELGGRQLKYGLKSIIKQEMDTSNWRPTPGGNAGYGESSMAYGDWRSKLQADSRETILNNIVDTLKRHVQFSGHDGVQELKKIAMRFEEKIYTAATSQSDYLQKISLKMLTMETGSQNPMPDKRQSNSAANCVNPLDPGLKSIIKQERDTSNCRHTPGGSAGGDDSSMESGDWRSKLQADSRERILNNIVDTLKRHIPLSGHEELQKYKKLAVRFEEKIYAASTSLSDYLRKISVKMLMLETTPQNLIPEARQTNSASNCVNPSDPVTISSDNGVIKRNKSMSSTSETGKDKMDDNTMKRQRVTSSRNAIILIEGDIHGGPREKDLPSDSDFEEQPRTQVKGMKKVNNDEKLMKMVKVKKANVTKKKEKRIPVGLRTRTSPKTLWETVKMLDENQRAAVRDIGLESLLDLTLDGIPSKLGYYVVDKLDTRHMNLKLRNGAIPITVHSIHELLGLPIGGLDLNSINRAIGDDDITVSWRKQFTKDRMRPKDVMAVIQQTDDAGIKFKLNFLVIVVNTLAECSRVGCCNVRFLSRIQSVDMISKIDWCKYIYDCLATSKRSWKRDSYLSFYTGPLTYLTLLYVESTECDKVHIEHRKPATKAWTLELLRRRQDVELDEGGLGYAPLRGMLTEQRGINTSEGRTSTCEKKEKTPTKLSKEACIQSLNKKIADLLMLRWEADAMLAAAIERFPRDPDFDRIKKKLASIFKNSKWETNEDRNQEVDPPLACAYTPVALSETPVSSNTHVDNLALVEVTQPVTIIMPSISSPLSQYGTRRELDLEKGRENKDVLKRKASSTSLDTKKQRTESGCAERTPSLTDVDLSNVIDTGKMAVVSFKDTEAKLEEKDRENRELKARLLDISSRAREAETKASAFEAGEKAAKSALAEREDEVLKLKTSNETTKKMVKELEERLDKLESFVRLKTRTQTQIMCRYLAGKDGLKDAAVKLDNFLKEVDTEDDLKSDEDVAPQNLTRGL
ncbi:hypothetical protein L6452_32258 [Arctium lappa]|uniref:Uncharacterized protein n=1 Tax=Arctium lappa TaxID=4217 RepID=A0ACB8Z4G6_ARCLA|nr:hypothetical protein L6452_32258 [Arctium lappa]